MTNFRKQKGNAFDELYDRIWKTKSARFNAYHRLKKKKIMSSYTLSLLSVYVIILKLLEPFKIIQNAETLETVNFLSICVSILLLVFVLIENSMEYNLKAEKFHNCSKSLARLFKDLEIIKESKSDYEKTNGIKKITEKYDNIIDLYDNHDPIDFELHRVNNNLKDYNDRKKWFIRNTYHYFNNLIYYLAIYLVPIILVLTIIILNKYNDVELIVN